MVLTFLNIKKIHSARHDVPFSGLVGKTAMLGLFPVDTSHDFAAFRIQSMPGLGFILFGWCCMHPDQSTNIEYIEWMATVAGTPILMTPKQCSVLGGIRCIENLFPLYSSSRKQDAMFVEDKRTAL